MFSLLAILALLLWVGAFPIVAARLFVKKSRDDFESQRELLAIAVETEKLRTSLRARHQKPDEVVIVEPSTHRVIQVVD
jgi:hypothetical protein